MADGEAREKAGGFFQNLREGAKDYLTCRYEHDLPMRDAKSSAIGASHAGFGHPKRTPGYLSSTCLSGRLDVYNSPDELQPSWCREMWR